MIRHQLIAGLVAFVSAALDGGTASAQMEWYGNRGGGIFFVAGNPAVQKEIGFDASVSTEVNKIVEQFRQERRAAQERTLQEGKKVAILKDLSEKERKEKRRTVLETFDSDIKKLNERFVTQLKTAVLAEQFERLQQIKWQLYGSKALVDDDLTQTLELNADQIERIGAINKEWYRKRDELLRQQLYTAAKGRELELECNDKAIQVLSNEQQEKLTKLKGQPFDVSLIEP